MIKIITAAQMRELDRRTISDAHIPATILMERAGSGVVSCLEQRWGPVRGKTITVVCGKGNNGGDGFVAARLLRRRHANVRVLAMTSTAELSRGGQVGLGAYQRPVRPPRQLALVAEQAALLERVEP